MRFTRRSLAILLVFVLALAACGDDGDRDTADDSAAVGDTSSASQTGQSDEGGAVDPNGTLRLAASIAPSQWDPHLGRSAVVDYSLMGPIYDRLLVLEPDMTFGPMLATSYELSDDAMTMSMDLRTDVKFHDGTPFDASAVEANIMYTKGLDSFYADLVQLVDRVEVVDADSVLFHFNEPGTNFPLTLAFYTGVGGMVSPKALANPSSLTTTPAGSGPYNLVQQLQDRAIYERVPGYWDKQIDARAPKRLEMISISDDNARYAALQSGQVDGAVVINPVADIDRIADGDKIKLAEFPNNRILDVLINYQNPELAKPEVRKALSLAIDRAAIAQSVVFDACIPSLQAASEGGPGFAEDAAAPDQDIEEAKRLLQEAGVTSLSLKAEAVASPLFQNMATALQAQWAEIGVSIEITPIVSQESLGQWRTGNFDLYVQTASGFPDPGQLIEDYFARTNMPGGSDPELIEMQDAALKLPIGSDERNEAYADLNTYMSENPVNLIVCTWPTQVLYSSKVTGLDGMGITRLQSAWDTRHLALLAE